MVSYKDLLTETQKEQTYSPSLEEIRAVPPDMPTEAVPASHNVVSANVNMRTPKTIVHRNVSHSKSQSLSGHPRSHISPVNRLCFTASQQWLQTLFCMDTVSVFGKFCFFFFVLFLSLKKLADLGNAQALEKPHGYRVRVIAGPLKNQEFSKVLDVRPYNVEIAKELRNSGNRVENL